MKYQTDGTYIGTLTLSVNFIQIQGLTFFGGFIYITSSLYNQVLKFSTDGTFMGVVYTFAVGATPEIEGISNNGTNLVFIGYTPGFYAKAYFLQ